MAARGQELLLLYLAEVRQSFEAAVVPAKGQAEAKEASPVLVTLIEVI